MKYERYLEMLMDLQNTGGMSVPSSNTRLAFSYLITKESNIGLCVSAVCTQNCFVAAIVKDTVLYFLHPTMWEDALFY